MSRILNFPAEVLPITEDEDYKNAERVGVGMIEGYRSKGREPTPDLVETILDDLLKLKLYEGLDRERLRKLLERRVSVFVDTPHILESISDHRAWLKARKPAIEWRFWERYKRYLSDVKAWPVETVRSLDEITEEILERLENPAEEHRAFDRRGMVVGHVQSGKTANYTALICKAVDAGYKLIIVLAGGHNNLRSQTQMRLDEEFLGSDTAQFRRADRAGSRIGVGKLFGQEHLPVQSLTSRLDDGDFKTAMAAGMLVDIGTVPTILVVKKNATILRNVVQYFRSSPLAKKDPAKGISVIERVSSLVIDDECDYASVNTKEVPLDEDGNRSEDYDPTRINGLIRQLLMIFQQRAYVGYTATPFANIFIYSDDRSRDYGPDLFPRSFILSLPAPTDYTGPEQVFGLNDGSKARQPVVRLIDDYRPFIPDDHRKDHTPQGLCESLREAISSFVLSTAIRNARGFGSSHNSMLIHVTRFTDVQSKVAELVRQEVEDLRNRIKFGMGKKELEDIWDTKYIPVTKEMECWNPAETWNNIALQLVPVVEKLSVLVINGTAKDVLDYREYSDMGLNVIVIGGDKLSRGLTLEGLTVSYYLRASKMYDTLMQMGRWFGYRKGYEDLCRIFTTSEIADWYRDIASASMELREELESMAAQGATPESYGLRVKSHPVLMVTSPVKMRDGETLEISYAGKIEETTVYDPSPFVVEYNFNLTDAFIRNLPGKPNDDSKGYYKWSKIDGSTVAKFLASMKTHRNAPDVNGPRLAEYIELQMKNNELVDWTVALVSKTVVEPGKQSKNDSSGPVYRIEVGGLNVNATQRAPTSGQYRKGKKFSIRRILSPNHESIDLTETEWKNAIEYQKITAGTTDVVPKKDDVNGPNIRRARECTKGLLLIYVLDPDYICKWVTDPRQNKDSPDASFTLPKPVIGFGVSFPESTTAEKVRYTVNNVYWEQEYGAGT